jgi:putative drug exporter of the RND superfamily
MFSLLGKNVARFWPVWLGIWLIVLGAGWLFAPRWDDVTEGGDIPFLPDDSPSRRGDQLFKTAFPEEYSGGSVVVVFSREEGTGLQEEDRRFIAEVFTPQLQKLAAASTAHGESIIARIRTPQDQGIGALLLNRDKHAALVLVELKTAFLDQRNWTTIEAIEKLIASLRGANDFPNGLDINVTGSATAGRDMGLAEQKSARDIEVWTIVVVVGLLLLTYRAPLVALLPLVTIFVGVQVALYCLASLAQMQVFAVSRDIRIFITVIAYGAGVDYCVFLIAGYQEELDSGSGIGEALARAIGKAGVAVSASAATVICGIGMMPSLASARFGTPAWRFPSACS